MFKNIKRFYKIQIEIRLFIFQPFKMDTLEQPSNDLLENSDEPESLNKSSGILKINRNEIEAIPTSKQVLNRIKI